MGNPATDPVRRPGPSGAVDRALWALEDALVLVAGLVIFALMIVVTADVILRSTFNYPLPNSYEYMELGMVFVVYLGASKVQREKGHIAIDIVVKRLPPRGRAVVELIGCVIGLVLMGAIGWFGALAAWNSFLTSEYIGSVARLPVLPARLALVAGVFVLCLRLLSDVWRYGRAIVRPALVPPIMEGHL
jgi:TRAP-type C4-dicarboxylate transport system permease small subunit